MAQADGQAIVAGALGQSGSLVNLVQVGSGYEPYDGTSMATPHVAGVAGLLWSHYPSATNQDIRDALTTTAIDLGSAGRDSAYGYGLIQAKAAYDLLAG